MEPCFSRTPNQAMRKPATTTAVEAAIAPVCPVWPPPKPPIRKTATIEPRVGKPPVNMT